jgi:hypothetical protein
MAVLVESQSRDIVDYFWGIKIFDYDGPFGKGKLCDSVTHDLLILFRLIDLTKISLLVLVVLILLFCSLEWVEIFVLNFLDVLVPFLGGLTILHIFFYNIQRITAPDKTLRTRPERQANHPFH